MRNSKHRPSLRGAVSAVAVVVAGVAAIALLASCGAERHETMRTVQTRETSVVPPPRMTDISIINLHDEPSTDPATEKVVGTIVNNGDRAVSQLTIRVDALDGTGQVLNSVTTPPLEETIAANGGMGQFTAQMSKNPAVTTYHAVAVAR